MSEFITFKRWTLKDGRQKSELVNLVREEIIPHYEKLPGCLRLGLLRIDDTRSYLALQHWENRDSWHTTTNTDYYKSWYEAYEPTLKRWDGIMTFEEEWDSQDLLPTGSSI
jgi:quinol monooxygenase YgiN